MTRIGILGGTFDPPHIGHLLLAQCALEQANLDRVLFVPSGLPAYKQMTVVAASEHRLAMCELAIEGNPGFAVSNIEVAREGISYTVDTLRELCELYGHQTELFLIVGSDAAAEMSSWKGADELFALAHVLSAQRAALADIPIEQSRSKASILSLNMPALDISSSGLRQMLAAGISVRYLIPDKVIAYVRKHSLYVR